MKSVVAEHEEQHLSYGKYIAGFAMSVLLTLMAYLLVSRHAGGTNTIVALVSGLAIMQFLVQMVFFLHIGEERKPRWKLGALLFAVVIVLIIVFGSVWIMNSLNYRMTQSPGHVEQYLRTQNGGI